jgi:hypothetical protein
MWTKWVVELQQYNVQQQQQQQQQQWNTHRQQSYKYDKR